MLVERGGDTDGDVANVDLTKIYINEKSRFELERFLPRLNS